MKPIGYKKMSKEVMSLDKMPHKSVKKWKRGEKQRLKRQLEKDCIPIDIP